jgi:hypothetical protein
MMRRFVAALTTLALLIVSTPGLFARPIQVRRTWDELSRMIPGMTIRIVLPDTTRIAGPALEVRPDVLVMEVRRTSDPRRHAKGLTQIPRPDVSTVELLARRPPGSHPDAGAIGAGLGGVAVSPLLLYLGETDKISGWGALAIAIGGAAGGAMLAKRLRGNPTDLLITVVPE